MARSRVRLVLLGALLVSCATLHPEFDQRITSGTGWMLFIASRYGCDTVAVRASRPVPRQPLAQEAPPQQVPTEPPSAPPTSPRAARGARNPPPVAAQPPRPRFDSSVLLGATPCALANPMPSEVRGFKIEDGIREEWLSGGALLFRFEGPHPTQLRVVRVGLP